MIYREIRKSDYHVIKHLINQSFRLSHLKMNIQAYIKRCDIHSYKDMTTIYKQLIADHKHDFDGVLTLFAVSEKSRGLGIGTTLLLGFKEYLNRNKVKQIYLYTDSSCNTGFYDSQGFQQIEKANLNIANNKHLKSLEVYLYSLNLS